MVRILREASISVIGIAAIVTARGRRRRRRLIIRRIAIIRRGTEQTTGNDSCSGPNGGSFQAPSALVADDATESGTGQTADGGSRFGVGGIGVAGNACEQDAAGK